MSVEAICVKALGETEEMRNEKYEKYVARGMPEEEAREIVYQKVLWRLKQIFFDQYVDFLYYSQQLHDYDRHINFLTDLDSKLDEK